MRLFYGGRAFKDPPLTTIFLLVFVLVCHGVSGDETTTADSTTGVASTTTVDRGVDCDNIPETTSIDKIIEKCTNEKRFSYNGKWLQMSKVTKQKIEKFFENKAECRTGIHIQDNRVIDKLSLKNVEIIGRDAVGLHIVNTNLQEIQFYKAKKGSSRALKLYGTIIVRGNKKLDQATLSMIESRAQGTDKDIQRFGECFVPPLITDLKELDDCHYIVGDLRFANWPIGTTTNEIKRIMGNVTIINADLTRLPFAQTGKIKIDGNFEFKDNIGLCWINDENYKDYFDVKGKAKVRNTPCPYPPSLPTNKTTKKTKKSKKTTTTAAPATAEEETTTKGSDTVFAVVPALSALFIILL